MIVDVANLDGESEGAAMSETQDNDPRAKWRELPPEPAEYVEETSIEIRAADLGIPAIDLTEDWVRKYGL